MLTFASTRLLCFLQISWMMLGAAGWGLSAAQCRQTLPSLPSWAVKLACNIKMRNKIRTVPVYCMCHMHMSHVHVHITCTYMYHNQKICSGIQNRAVPIILFIILFRISPKMLLLFPRMAPLFSIIPSKIKKSTYKNMRVQRLYCNIIELSASNAEVVLRELELEFSNASAMSRTQQI